MEKLTKNVNEQLNISTKGNAQPKEKKPYTRPRLDDYGRLQNVTLGGSPGLGDSGSSGTEQEL